jgi:hypothetical protein
MRAIASLGCEGALRAIASLGCEEAMRAIFPSTSPHALPPPRQGPTPTLCAATVSGITSIQTSVCAAAKTLPTTPTRQRYIAARVKGYCIDKAIFTLLRTTDELFFSCCDSVAAHFKHAATRQPDVPQAEENCCIIPTTLRSYGHGHRLWHYGQVNANETCVDNTAKLRPRASLLAPRPCT